MRGGSLGRRGRNQAGGLHPRPPEAAPGWPALHEATFSALSGSCRASLEQCSTSTCGLGAPRPALLLWIRKVTVLPSTEHLTRCWGQGLLLRDLISFVQQPCEVGIFSHSILETGKLRLQKYLMTCPRWPQLRVFVMVKESVAIILEGSIKKMAIMSQVYPHFYSPEILSIFKNEIKGRSISKQ